MNNFRLINIFSKIVLLLTIVLMQSCSNEDLNSSKIEDASLDVKNELSFTETMSIYSSKKEPGSILLQVSDFNGQPRDSHNSYISKMPLDKNSANTSIKDIQLYDNKGNALGLDNLLNLKSSNYNIHSLFGQELTYYEDNNGIITSKNGGSAAKTLTLPDLITINMNTTVARAGSIISWNIDDSNDHGVVIVATYNPLDQTDLSIAQSNPYKIVRGIALPDLNGSYTVRESDLERFPDNSIIDLTVARGTTTTSTNKSPTVTAITQTSTLVNIDY